MATPFNPVEPARLDHLDSEQKQRLRQLVKSDDFLQLFVEKLVLPYMTNCLAQLQRPFSERQHDDIMKGCLYGARFILNSACLAAGLPNLFELRHALGYQPSSPSPPPPDDAMSTTDAVHGEPRESDRTYNAFLAE